MKARIPRTYDQLSPKEQRAIYSAVYADVSKKAATIVTTMAQELAKSRTVAAIECGLYASFITLVDEFDFGTDASKLAGRQSKLQRFTNGYLETLNGAGDRYDEYMISGLRWQCQQRGIDTDYDFTHIAKQKSLEEIAEEITARIKAGEEGQA